MKYINQSNSLYRKLELIAIVHYLIHAFLTFISQSCVFIFEKNLDLGISLCMFNEILIY